MKTVTVDLYDFDQLREDSKLLKCIKEELENVEVKYYSVRAIDYPRFESKAYLEMTEYNMMDKLLAVKRLAK